MTGYHSKYFITTTYIDIISLKSDMLPLTGYICYLATLCVGLKFLSIKEALSNICVPADNVLFTYITVIHGN